MKRFSLVVGLVGLGILSTACSGTSDEPAPFAGSTDLESRMAADLGAPVAIEQDGHSTFVVARGTSRTIAANDDSGESVTRWIERYATTSPRLVGTVEEDLPAEPRSAYPYDADVRATFGGKNNKSSIVIEKGIGWSTSEKLWTAMLGPQLTTANGTLQLAMVEDIGTAARAQVAHARLLDVVAPGTLAAVACAWHAVGALDAATVAHLASIQCRVAQPRQCAGKANGWQLDEAQEFAAVKCMGGSTVDGHQCPDFPMVDKNGRQLPGVAKRTKVPRTINRMFDGPVELDPKTGRPTWVDPWK